MYSTDLEETQWQVFKKILNVQDRKMDSQSVRWGDNRSLNGIDGNKKVKGVKRHVVVDKNGFLIAVMETIASVHD